jgi:hypothetical protein
MKDSRIFGFLMLILFLIGTQFGVCANPIKTTTISVGSGGVSLGSYQGGYLYGKQ